jgi:hypothetical protein
MAVGAAETQAADLALWRAALLTLERRRGGFRIERRTVAVKIVKSPGRSYYTTHYHYRRIQGRTYAIPHYVHHYEPPRIRARAVATLFIRLTGANAPDVRDARKTLARLRARHGDNPRPGLRY